MRNILFFALLLIFSDSNIFAQNKKDLHPCGTVSHRSDWLKNYQRNPHLYQTENDTVLYVPLTIHLVGSDNGTGHFQFDNVMNALCILNEDFEQVNMHFFVEGDIKYINNSAWNNHDSVLDGAEMMFANNVENTLNCYFVSDPAGNCGYNLPYAGMAMAKSCAGIGDHTWSHEMGHALSLPHPFLGWEGGVSHDGSVQHSYNDPAPETVLFNYTYFKDTLIMDTVIIDTAYVEKTDGSNCHFAADGFCDTKPDYLSSRWPCGSDSLSNTVQTDPDTVQFVSDGKLIMSYSFDSCVDGFSDEQIGAMRANLQEEKANVLYNQTPVPAPEGPPVVLWPLTDDLVPFEDVTLEWEPVVGTEGYFVHVFRILGASSIPIDEYHTTETFVNIGDLTNLKEYAWEVTAYNNHHYCPVYSERQRFETTDVSAVGGIPDISGFSVFPTLIQDDFRVQIRLNSEKTEELTLRVYDLTGRNVFEQNQMIMTGKNEFSVDLKGMVSGMYLIGLEGLNGRVFERLVIER